MGSFFILRPFTYEIVNIPFFGKNVTLIDTKKLPAHEEVI